MSPRNALVGIATSTAVLAGLAATQFGCPPPPPAGGVSAGEVETALNQRFSSVDRALLLWSVQPNLATVMLEYGLRFFMMQKAAEAGDWAMARYQLTEQLETQREAETISGAGQAALLTSFQQNSLDPLATDIQNKDLPSFTAHFNEAVTGCNNCHAATLHGYIVVRPAMQIPEANLTLAASEPVAPAEPEDFITPTPPFPADQALTGDQVNQLIDFYFNNVNRNLALWNVQAGLGTMMIEYGLRFAMLRLSADVTDWGMAAYQLARARDLQGIVSITRPAVAAQLAAFDSTFLQPLETAIGNQDAAGFTNAYTAALGGCNACHVTNARPYIRVQLPTRTPEPILALAASQFQAPPPGPAANANPPTIPETPTLADATTAIDFRFNNIDRTLALWNAQRTLGSLMIENGYHFGQAWFAVAAQDWPMVAYEIQQAIAIQDIAGSLRPDLEQPLESYEQIYFQPVQAAVNAQSLLGFQAAYTTAITGCNNCHTSTGVPYVRVQIPPAPYVDFVTP